MNRFLMNFSYSFIYRFVYSFINHLLKACRFLGAVLSMGMQNWKSPASVLILVNLLPEWLGECHFHSEQGSLYDLLILVSSLLPFSLNHRWLFPLSSLLSHLIYFTPSMWSCLLIHMNNGLSIGNILTIFFLCRVYLYTVIWSLVSSCLRERDIRPHTSIWTLCPSFPAFFSSLIYKFLLVIFSFCLLIPSSWSIDLLMLLIHTE